MCPVAVFLFVLSHKTAHTYSAIHHFHVGINIDVRTLRFTICYFPHANGSIDLFTAHEAVTDGEIPIWCRFSFVFLLSHVVPTSTYINRGIGIRLGSDGGQSGRHKRFVHRWKGRPVECCLTHRERQSFVWERGRVCQRIWFQTSWDDGLWKHPFGIYCGGWYCGIDGIYRVLLLVIQGVTFFLLYKNRKRWGTFSLLVFFCKHCLNRHFLFILHVVYDFLFCDIE